MEGEEDARKGVLAGGRRVDAAIFPALELSIFLSPSAAIIPLPTTTLASSLSVLCSGT